MPEVRIGLRAVTLESKLAKVFTFTVKQFPVHNQRMTCYEYAVYSVIIAKIKINRTVQLENVCEN
jgi:hypothetical protein